MLKSLAALNKMGNEMRKDRDVGRDMAQMLSFMENATTTMSVMADQAASTVPMDGVDATATVVSARQTGMVNFDPLVELELLVTVGGLPMPVTTTQVVPSLQLSKVQPGSSLPVKVGAFPSDFFIDWMRA